MVNYQDVLSSCPGIVEELKGQLESALVTAEPEYSKYYNFPSCSSGDWAERYWGSNLPSLLSIKTAWDPDNVFNHCQSVGSSQEDGQTCCPFSDSATPTSAPTPAPSGCLTVSGSPCVFPFSWQGVIHSSCTTAGGFSSPWCSTRTDRSVLHQGGKYYSQD